MLYETLDHVQIDAVMEGRMPDPPAEWSDGSGDSGASSDKDKAKSQDAADSSGPIGGPAQEH